MIKFSEGDTVKLVSLSIHRSEQHNWLLREQAAGLKVELNQEFTIDAVDYDTSDGWISLMELNHFHPSDKFHLVKRAKQNLDVYSTNSEKN